MEKQVISWLGNLSQGNGYSGSSELLAMALDKYADVRIMTVLPVEVQKKRKHKAKKNRLNKSHPIYNKPYKQGKIGVYYGFPVGFNSLQNKKKIGFTMFETTKLPNGITVKGGNPYAGKTGKVKDCINGVVDLLLVPSQHNKELFRKEGVEVPIKVLHLGIDPEMYPYCERPERKTFTFLMTGTITGRKNPFNVMKAFASLFKDNEDVKLIIKTKEGSMPNLRFTNLNIEIIDQFATPKEMLNYYQEADCFVFPSRGEGFGLPPLEAMATGLPTIISDNTGMSEYANSKYNYVIRKNELIKASNFPKKWGDVGYFYNPDYDELKKIMRYVYNNRDEAKKKGKLASDWVHSYWTYDHSAQRLLEIIRELSD